MKDTKRVPGHNVLIIGAGLAGLAAANELSNNGLRVTVLEARNRIGGRTHTDYSLGCPIDLGASIIHGINKNPITDLAQKFNCITKPITLDTIFVSDLKVQYTPEQINESQQKFDHFLMAAKQVADYSHHDIPLSQALKTVLAESKETLRPMLLGWHKLFTTLYTGADLEQLSAKHWDDEVVLEGSQNLLLSGYFPIVTSLATNLDIRLETEVYQINYSNKRVKVFTNKGCIEADSVIITVPLGVLKQDKIDFIPKLPHEKVLAISQLEMGVLNKICLKFPNIFWPKEYTIFPFGSNQDQLTGSFHNLHPYFDQPILMGALAGKNAIEFEGMSDEAIIDKSLTILRSMFGCNISLPTATIITRWASDPHSFGSYSFFPVNSSRKDCVLISEPIENRLFFAGEATNHLYPATTHGAYLSGIREAERLMKGIAYL